MTTHLYCILPNDRRGLLPRGLTGVDSSTVRTIAVGGIVAWVSDVERRLAVSVSGIRAHDSVVEAALETGATPVPARFGQRFDNDDACRATLAIRAASVETILTRIQGLVEMTLIITPSTGRMLRDLQPAAAAAAAAAAGENTALGSDEDYLEGMRSTEEETGVIRRAIDDLAQRLTEAARRHIRRAAVHEQFTRLPLRTLAHLIPRGSVDQYRETLRPLPTSREFRFLVIGPRAPYSFCSLNAGDGGAYGMKLAD